MSSSTPNTTSATSGIIDAPLSSWGIFSAEASLVINEVVQSERIALAPGIGRLLATAGIGAQADVPVWSDDLDDLYATLLPEGTKILRSVLKPQIFCLSFVCL
jgi:hypothetical protein